jgi:hypothetical protein
MVEEGQSLPDEPKFCQVETNRKKEEEKKKKSGIASLGLV